jgi:LPLT family lysophospholipid transporter-like MFS transporter
MIAVVAAQFLSSLADNALLFVALAVLRAEHYPAWSAPLLQTFFVGAFILLAPFVGPFADSMPKGRVMLLSNGLKLLGSLGMLLSMNPFIAYCLAGIGAAAYSPAKFGILAELVPAEQLVTANAVVEAASFSASLAGALAGGTLADAGAWQALACVTGIYAASGLANLFVPRLEAAHRLERATITGIVRDFVHTVHELYRLPDARFAILGTSLFSGVGTTLRFLLVAWVPVALGVAGVSLPAYLNATAVVGIVAGAVLASRHIKLDSVDRVLPAGALIGLALIVLSAVTHTPTAFGILAMMGTCGGFFLVPLNALLQARGRQSVGAGHAIAVQNLTENAVMLAMLGLYTAILRAGVSVELIADGFGAGIVAAVASLWLKRSKVRATTRGTLD